MNLQEIRKTLENLDEVRFKLPNGTSIPPHFHVTEVGKVQKHFIDCGGVIRRNSVINFQLYVANDYDHRLSVKKLRAIIELSASKLELDNDEIEVEYQGETIGTYGLEFDGTHFVLTNQQTACLAKDQCGISPAKSKVKLAALQSDKGCCDPASGCC